MQQPTWANLHVRLVCHGTFTKPASVLPELHEPTGSTSATIQPNCHIYQAQLWVLVDTLENFDFMWTNPIYYNKHHKHLSFLSKHVSKTLTLVLVTTVHVFTLQEVMRYLLDSVYQPQCALQLGAAGSTSLSWCASLSLYPSAVLILVCGSSPSNPKLLLWKEN